MKTSLFRIRNLLCCCLLASSVFQGYLAAESASTNGFSASTAETYLLNYLGEPVHSFYPSDDVCFSLGAGGVLYTYARKTDDGWRERNVIAEDVEQASVGKDFILILKKDHDLYWYPLVSSDDETLVAGVELGDGTVIARRVQRVSAGDDHYVFVYENGMLMGGGYDAGDGRLTGNSVRSLAVPVQLATGVKTASAGQGFTLFVKTDNSLWVMGANAYGNLGTGNFSPVYNPQKIASGVASVQGERSASWYITTTGGLYAMGNQFGNEPVHLSLAQDVKQAAISHSQGSILWVEQDGDVFYGSGVEPQYYSGGIRGLNVTALNRGFLTVKQGVPLFRFVSEGTNHVAGNPFRSAIAGVRFMSILPDEVSLAEKFLSWNGINHYVQTGPIEGAKPVYRFYNWMFNFHFYTISEAEKAAVEANHGYTYEGVAYYAWDYPVAGSEPVYRFFSPKTFSHYYTIGDAEKAQLIANGTDRDWQFEGIAYWAYSFFGEQ